MDWRKCGIVLAVLFAISGTGHCWGQEYRAAITGVVTDSSNAVIPNATVTVRNLDTGQVTTVKTNAVGVYVVSYLPPAQRLVVSAEMQGFMKESYPPVVLTISQVQTANFVLRVGVTTQQITVNSQSYKVGLDTEQADRGVVVDNKTITQLPLNGRNPLSLMDYIPGVTDEAGTGSEGVPNNMYNISFFTVNGTPAQNTDYSIDGMPDNSNPWYSNGPSTVPSVDAIQEFKVVTNPYDASYGRTSSGVVSMDLKSGTNSFHGSVYEFAKRGYMDANSWENNYVDQPRPAHTEDQYGFEVAGPVYIPHIYHGQNKTFFMFNLERFKEVLPTFQTYDIPNAAWATGDFSDFVDPSGALMPVYNPFSATTADPTRQIFQYNGHYNQVDPNLLNPIAVKMVNMMLSAATPTTIRFPGELPWESIWIDTVPATSNSQNYIVKFDHALTNRDHLSGSWIRSYNPSFSPNTPANVPWFNGSTFTEYHMNAGLDWVHTYRSNLISDIHFSYQRYWRTDGPIAANLNYNPAQLGFSSSLLNQLPLKLGFPELNFNMQQQSTGTGNGYNNWLAMSRDFYYMPDDSYNVSPVVTWNKGRHNIRLGLDYRDSHLWQEFQYDNTIAFTSNGIATSEYWDQNDSNDVAALPNGTPLSQNGSGNAVLDFLLGQPNSVQVQNQDLPYYTWHYYAPWVQDDWKLTPTLTLNLGFRYDLNLPPTARHNWLDTGFDFNATNPISSQVAGLGILKGGITFPTTSGTNRPWAPDYTKWQPRLGFAWLMLPGTVIRGGAGRVVLSPPDEPQSAGFTNNPVYTNSPDSGRTYYPDNLGNPFPQGIPAIPGASQGLQTYLGQYVVYSNPKYKLPSVIDSSLGIEQALPKDGKLDVSAVLSRGYGLDTNYGDRDVNYGLYRSCNATLGTASNPYPQGQCENLAPNPFYGVPGFVGGYETSTELPNIYLASPYPEFSGMEEVQNNWGHSWYNSLQATYQQRLGWEQLNATYTWSKTMQSGGYTDGVYLIPVRTIAGTDRQNRITVTSVLDFPIGRGMKYLSDMNRPLDAVIGGWELAADSFAETGQPVGLDTGYNIVGNIRSMKPKHSTSDIIDEGVNQCVELWNDATPTTPGYYKLFTGNGETEASCQGNVAWQQVAPYAPSTTQANSDQIRGPGTFQIDSNLSKNFKLTERVSMQLRMEEFNVLNHPTWYDQVDMNPTDTNFGTVNKILTYGQSNNPRYGQLGVKVLW
ncbi:MAG: TonB-dependent receptor [Acidobacteriaceae bacterium]